MTLTEFYEQLMIIQYYEQPKARAEIGLKAGYNQDLKQFIDDLKQSFDLGIAADDRLDKIGKLVGQSRIIPFGTEKILFGFDGDATARGMADLFNDAVESAPFSDLFTPDYTSTQLGNNDYRTFIKARIAKNVCRAVMVGDDSSISIQDAIQSLFEGQAIVFDNRDMTLSLQVGFSYSSDLLGLIFKADLLPRPQGVDYKIIYASEIDSFGFDDDPNAKGFGNLFEPSVGGSFAELYII